MRRSARDADRAAAGPKNGDGSDQPPGPHDVDALYVLIFIVELGLGILSPILPEIMREFSLTAWQVGMTMTAFGVARLVIDLPLGLLLDRLDRTKTIFLGSLLIVVGSTGCGLAQDYVVLLAARLLMGAGTALCIVTTLFTVSRTAHAASMGTAIGAYQAAALAGMTFSPALGGAAASIAGWRAAFFFCALTGLLGMLLLLVVSRQGRLRFSPSPPRKARPEGRPAMGSRLNRLPWNLIAINFTTLVFFASTTGFRNSMVPVYGGTELGLSAGTLGLLLGGSALVRFMVTLGSGFASDRYGRKVILIPGTILLAAGTLGFSLSRDLPTFALCLLILSLGGFGNSIPTTMVVDAVPASRVGLAIGVNRFVGDAGMIAGPVALGWVLDTMGFPSVAAVTAAFLLLTVPGVALAVHENRRRLRSTSAGSLH